MNQHTMLKPRTDIGKEGDSRRGPYKRTRKRRTTFRVEFIDQYDWSLIKQEELRFYIKLSLIVKNPLHVSTNYL